MSKAKEFKEKNTIEDSVIAGYAAQETMKLPGVIRMAPGIAESFSRNILGRITETQGVHVWGEHTTAFVRHPEPGEENHREGDGNFRRSS